VQRRRERHSGPHRRQLLGRLRSEHNRQRALHDHRRRHGRGDSGTECTNVDQNTFRCQPTGDATGVITGQFTNALGDAVCAEPPLTIDFTVTFDDDSTEEINDVRVANCSQDSGGGGTGGVVDTGEDNSRTPEGGVDSGAGGIRETGRRAGMAWALIAGASALGLGAVVLLARRRHRAG
jgi:LPXTG-motif cell wall-anchored protein